MVTCSVDFETRSTLDLSKVGVYRYAEHSTTDIWVMAYAIDDGPTKLWFPGEEIPGELELHVMLGGEMRAWNAQFERVIWREILGPRYGFPVPETEDWYCTQAEAIAMALPRSLGWTANVLNMGVEKDSDGRALMLQMAKPRKVEDDGTVIWWDDDERVARLADYCRQDVVVERAIMSRVRRLSPREREVYLVDQRINDRGVRVDIDLVQATRRFVDVETDKGNARLGELTDGVVTKVTQRERIHNAVLTAGYDMPDLKKYTLRDFLMRDDLDPVTREILEIRRDVGKTSASKLDAMLRCACSDEYVRGLLQYHGASTGRWAGQLVQPQNFPRGEVKNAERFIPDILAGRDPDHEKPVVLASALLRAMFIASPGSRLLGGDFSQIEARVLGFFAGEPYGSYEYEKMGGLIFTCDWRDIVADHEAGVHDPQQRRQIGKNTVLGCGFGMGAKRYREQAWEQTGEWLDEELCERAVYTYRSEKPGVPVFWNNIEAAAMEAVLRPGEVVTVPGTAIRYTVRSQFLWCVLPSKRVLAYALPRVEEVETPWGEMKPGLTYMGIDSYTKKWKRLKSYGGHLTENAVQAAARDLMADAMVRAERAGYRPILTVHDEVVCDTPDEVGSVEAFHDLLTETPDWADGCPVAAECWEGERYRK